LKPTRLEPLGDCAFIAHFNAEVAAAEWTAAVRASSLPGVTDVVLAYRSAAVYADPGNACLSRLESSIAAITATATAHAIGRRIIVPVLYDGTDLHEVATSLKISEAEVVSLHTSIDFHVFAIGFTPGFPYAGYLPDGLAGLPRRAVPRARVPAGSVAIAGRQTAIYPSESPGGWHLLGTTPLCIVDPVSGYFPIRAGDSLRFMPITTGEFEARRHERLT
jgi:KipI family sensor histidine kinase inhibitor